QVFHDGGKYRLSRRRAHHAQQGQSEGLPVGSDISQQSDVEIATIRRSLVRHAVYMESFK
ncbi:MAG: hypothetical protein RL300_517, partial [Pseudomonadota bacterium]